ncbi:UNVERIFIED_CONTAM: hypothetical protein FKN15_015566 [Acipenser sinensis]
MERKDGAGLFLNVITPLPGNRKTVKYYIICRTQIIRRADPAALREEGNCLFKNRDFQGALSCYTKALKLSDTQSECAVLHRNRAACYLKLDDYSKAESDASKALDSDPGDVKARFRRSQALQKLGRLDQAFKDIQRCAQLEPKNMTFQDSLRQLGAQIQDKVQQLSSTDARVQQMFSLLLDSSAQESDRHKVMFEALMEGMKKDVRGKEEAMLLEPSRELRSMLRHLLDVLTAPAVSGSGRDSAINLLVKHVPRKSQRDPDNSLTLWVIDQGLKTVLEVGGTVPEATQGPPLTDSTHMSCSVLLSKLYDDLKSDGERENFSSLCEEYVRSHFESSGLVGKLRAIQTVSVLLQGPSEVGNQALGLSGIMESIILLCGSDTEIHQQVAVEALIHAAGKAKRASFITANGVALLKDIYKKSKSDKIRVRALVGLCKLGSAGGTDFSMKQFAEGSTLKLAKQCRKWLCNEALPPSSRRWAIEGLAYLTFDADVKEELAEDGQALQAMFQLAKSEDKTVLFAVGSTLVNCTNSYDSEKLDPQMVELAKYAKQHVPEEHPKDAKPFVEKRLSKLLEAGVVSALVCMVKQESPALTDACKECIARVFLAVVEKPEDRGTVVAQGGGKALIPLATEGTDTGKTKAAQTLAKITITSNPEIAFPGERIYEVVRPLVSLLGLDCTALQNFEALMALTNLAGISERLRQKIMKEGAVSKIEGYMFEDHEMIRVAATECMCNLVLSPDVQERFVAEDNDRLKLLVLYSGEDDERLRKAAAGTLAMLTSVQPSLCARVPRTTSHWLEILQALLLSESRELQHRAAVIAMNLMQAERGLAEQLIESEVLEILSVMTKGGAAEHNPACRAAKQCLDIALEYGLIKPNPAE